MTDLKTIKRLTIHCVREAVTPYNRVLSSSPHVAQLAHDIVGKLDVEVVLVFLLDAKNCVTGYSEVARGGATASVLHAREVFRLAVLEGAVSIIVVHNHPSGDPHPSESDNAVTERLAEAARVLDIALLDHVIVGGDNHYSYRDHQRICG